MEKQPSQHTPASIARNIGIGVITPVLAATIIYFFGFNRNDTTEFKKKKDATVRTWSAFVQNKSIFSTVFKQMNDSTITDIEVMRSRVNHEIDITLDNMENIKKEPNADQRVYSTIDITMQQIKEIKPIMNKFIDDMIAYSATNPSDDALKTFAVQKQEDIVAQMIDLRQRDSVRLSVFYDGLNKDYDVTLPKH